MKSKEEPKLGVYCHYKTGHNYLVYCVGTHSETLDRMVSYRRVAVEKGERHDVWFRPLKMFMEKVEHEGKSVDRFKYVGPMVGSVLYTLDVPGVDTVKEQEWINLRFTRKVAAYAKFLEDDIDDDWACLIRLLAFKLGRMREKFLKNKISSDYKKMAKQIGEVERLLTRVSNEDYETDLRESTGFRKKWGKIIWTKLGPTPNGNMASTLRYENETDKNQKELRKESLAIHRRAEKMMEADIRKAFRIIQKNLRCWWD